MMAFLEVERPVCICVEAKRPRRLLLHFVEIVVVPDLYRDSVADERIVADNRVDADAGLSATDRCHDCGEELRNLHGDLV